MFTAPSFSLLRNVNKMVNLRTTYVPDLKLHNLGDFWVSAAKHGNRGDCEDFALAKRNILIEEYCDPRLLRLCVCTDETGSWHCVLTVDAPHSDGTVTTWVLDNRFPDIWSYQKLKAKGYTFYVRQVVGEAMWELINPLPFGVAI